MTGNNLQNIFLVYLGAVLPKYAKKNLIYLHKTFPRHIIISDLEINLKFDGVRTLVTNFDKQAQLMGL